MKIARINLLKRVAVAHVFLLLMLVSSSQISAQSANQFYITDIDHRGFPDVAVTFRAITGANKVLENLSENEINIYENEQRVVNFTFTTIPDLSPSHVVFVLDLGVYFDFNQDAVKSAMHHFAEGGYFRDGIDSVTILARVNGGGRDRTETLLSTTTSKSDFVETVKALNISPDNRETITNGLRAVESGVDTLSLSQFEPGNSTIIYIGRLIQQPGRTQAQIVPRAQDLSASAAEQGIAIYTFHAARDLAYDSALRALSDSSGGEYVPLFEDQDNRRSLSLIYQTIINRGIRYQVSYRSQLGTSNDRVVAIVPVGSPASTATHTIMYNVPLQQPNIAIVSPENNKRFPRNPTPDASGETWLYDLNSIDVVAEVTWPDGISRTVTTAVLLWADSQTELLTIPDPGGNSFTFTWDITDITEVGVRSFPIQVRVTDELGLSNTSPSQTIVIEVLSGEGVIIVPAPTLTPAPRATPADPCERDPDGSECKRETIKQASPLVGMVIFAIIAGILGFALFKARNELKKFSPANLRGAVNAIKTKIFGAEGASEPLAKLHIEIARPELEGEVVDMFNQKLTLGRDPQQCDVVLYPLQQESSVSRSHCTIQYDQGRFVITHHSNSITSVNNRRIRSGSPVPLNNGDVIVLGQIAVKGARLRFERLGEDAGTEDEPVESWPTDIFEDDVNDIDPFEDLPDVDDDIALNDGWLSGEAK